MSNDSERRKKDHLALCATDSVRFREKSSLFEEIQLLHRALPELGLDDVDTATSFCGKDFSAPLWVSAITGGTAEAAPFNRTMAALAEEMGIGFCLGSMKPMLKDPKRKIDFQVRDVAPSILIMANIGGTELAANGSDQILTALSEVGADGLTVHLNPAMELTQPGGDTDFKGVVPAITTLVERAPGLPVVVKETGCGLSWEDGEALKRAGVSKVEVAGAGGTSWVGVETLRAKGAQARLGEMLWDWGVPTAVSTAWMVARGFEVVAAGGVRSALDVAKALALGANLAGMAAPFVQAHQQGGTEMIRALLNDLINGLKAVMVITGVQRIGDFKTLPRITGPTLKRWIAAGEQEI